MDQIFSRRTNSHLVRHGWHAPRQQGSGEKQTTLGLRPLVASMTVTLGLDSPEDLFWGLSDVEEKRTQMTLRVPHASDTQRPKMPRRPILPVIPIPRLPFYSSAHPQMTQSQPPKSSDNKDHRPRCQTTLPHSLKTLHPLLAVEAWLPEDTADSLRW